MPMQPHVAGDIIIPFSDGELEAQRGDTTYPQISHRAGICPVMSPCDAFQWPLMVGWRERCL